MRQVKSLTPDREKRLAAKATQPLRKAASTRGLKANNANDENSSGVSNVKRGATAVKNAKGRARYWETSCVSDSG